MFHSCRGLAIRTYILSHTHIHYAKQIVLSASSFDSQMGEVMDKQRPTDDATSLARDQTDELQLEKTRLAAEFFAKAADGAALVRG